MLRGDEARIIVGSDEISPIMKQAIVAVEDRRFWEHRGVDLRGIFRAVWADIRNKEIVQGGSTITQQFVKNTYIKPERTVSRKLKEAALAWQLERRWSKDRILTAYLNTIYFGNGAYGIGMAARVYFEKTRERAHAPRSGAARRHPGEPDRVRPDREPDARAKARRDTVLALMFGQGLITQAQYDAAQRGAAAEPRPGAAAGNSRPGAVLRRVREEPADPVLRLRQGLRRRAQGPHDDRPRDSSGSRARRSTSGCPSRTGRRRRSSPSTRATGDMLAMIGGTSFSKSQFNLAVQGERQPGSSFKPFVLATALAQGISPSTTFVSKPQVISLGDKLWAVQQLRERSTSGRSTSGRRPSTPTTPCTRS